MFAHQVRATNSLASVRVSVTSCNSGCFAWRRRLVYGRGAGAVLGSRAEPGPCSRSGLFCPSFLGAQNYPARRLLLFLLAILTRVIEFSYSPHTNPEWTQAIFASASSYLRRARESISAARCAARARPASAQFRTLRLGRSLTFADLCIPHALCLWTLLLPGERLLGLCSRQEGRLETTPPSSAAARRMATSRAIAAKAAGPLAGAMHSHCAAAYTS